MDEGWKLRVGDTVLAELRNPSPDQPWIFCDFVPSAAFESYTALFEHDLMLLNSDRMDEWFAHDEVMSTVGFVLEPLTEGSAITEFVLHIDGNTAWFRY